MHKIPNIFGGHPFVPDIFWGYKADAGPSLCFKKNSEYPPGVPRKLFEHKANRPSVQTSAEDNETKLYVTEVFEVLENIP